ncbi:hypothetical protein [Morganella morganii IS15]|nr:hypothetical protein CSB69_1838 [Morganella morganii]EMP53587.1 hypothetical protein C790_00103 [Morganella morganii SC01]CDK67535.1 hypothetical protein [Morganella morganii IS15]
MSPSLRYLSLNPPSALYTGLPSRRMSVYCRYFHQKIIKTPVVF